MQMRFVIAFAADPAKNITRAAIAAGCVPESAGSTGANYLRLEKVQIFVREQERRNALAATVSTTGVVAQLQEIAQTSAIDCYQQDESGEISLKPIDKMPRFLTKVSVRRNRHGEQEVAVQVPSQLTALELLGRHLAMFTDNHSVEVSLTDGDRTAKANKLQFLEEKTRLLQAAP